VVNALTNTTVIGSIWNELTRLLVTSGFAQTNMVGNAPVTTAPLFNQAASLFVVQVLYVFLQGSGSAVKRSYSPHIALQYHMKSRLALNFVIPKDVCWAGTSADAELDHYGAVSSITNFLLSFSLIISITDTDERRFAQVFHTNILLNSFSAQFDESHIHCQQTN
jgi:hypothetical protein